MKTYMNSLFSLQQENLAEICEFQDPLPYQNKPRIHKQFEDIYIISKRLKSSNLFFIFLKLKEITQSRWS